MSRSQSLLPGRVHDFTVLFPRTGWLVVALLVLYLVSPLPSTYTHFYSQAQSGPFEFRATTWTDNLALSPGSSMTNASPGDPEPAFPVAQMVDGWLHLDFGVYPSGTNRNFPSVIVVTNTGGRPLFVSWHFCANLASYFDQQSEQTPIAPGGQAVLGFKLDTKRSDLPGEHFGTLHLSAIDGFLAHQVPVRLRLMDPGSGNKSKESTGQIGSESQGGG